MTLSCAVPLAKQSVTARQAAEALGLQVDRHGRCACPIHGGHDRNCKLYDGERGYYCFVCHSAGSVIDLVMNVLGTDMTEALRWLDSTFRLGLEIGEPTDRRKAGAVRKAVARKRELRMRQEEHRRELNRIKLDAVTLGMEIDRVIEAERPRRYSDGFSDAFCAALSAREQLREVEKDIDVEIAIAEERNR